MMPPMHKVQKAQARALMESAYYQALLDIIDEMKSNCNDNSTVGNNEFETVSLAIRREERLLTLKQLIEMIEENASQARG